ncbi:MAG: hypothetical protein HOP33_04230 [Verrucomicrobia bacterium]|nr:hypothetical protein [Verrucomicrobiota bacterium]
MKIKPDVPDARDDPSQKLGTRTPCLVLMRLSQPAPEATTTTTQSPTSSTARATIVTVVFKKTFTQSGYWHGGINE